MWIADRPLSQKCCDHIRTKPDRLKLAFLFSVSLYFHVSFEDHVSLLKLAWMDLFVEVVLEAILVDHEVVIGLVPFFIK